MENSVKRKNELRIKRARRVRKKLRGSALKPRLSIFKSNKHITVQLIDDEAGKTLVSLSSMMKEFRQQTQLKPMELAKMLGSGIAKLAKENNIERVVLDRGSYSYQGVVAQIADAARENNLQL
jgi:large subunit ribosomal protein L18